MSWNGTVAWNWENSAECCWYPCEDEKSAIEEARLDDPGMDEVWIADISDIDVCGSVDLDYLIEQMENDCNIEIDITDYERNVLQQRLDDVVAKWIGEFKVGADAFLLSNVRCVSLKEET